MGQAGFFDLDKGYQCLSENSDPLVELAALINFKAFLPKLVTALKRSYESKGRRPETSKSYAVEVVGRRFGAARSFVVI